MPISDADVVSISIRLLVSGNRFGNLSVMTRSRLR